MLYCSVLCCYAQTFSVMAATMVLGMPLGAFLTDRFSNNKQNIIVPAGLLSCGAFAGAAYASSWPMLYACLFAQGVSGPQIVGSLHAISNDGMSPQLIRDTHKLTVAWLPAGISSAVVQPATGAFTAEVRATRQALSVWGHIRGGCGCVL